MMRSVWQLAARQKLQLEKIRKKFPLVRVMSDEVDNEDYKFATSCFSGKIGVRHDISPIWPIQYWLS